MDHELRDGLEHKIERELANDLRARTHSHDSSGDGSSALSVSPRKNELRSRPNAVATSSSVGVLNDNNI